MTERRIDTGYEGCRVAALPLACRWCHQVGIIALLLLLLAALSGTVLSQPASAGTSSAETAQSPQPVPATPEASPSAPAAGTTREAAAPDARGSEAAPAQSTASAPAPPKPSTSKNTRKGSAARKPVTRPQEQPPVENQEEKAEEAMEPPPAILPTPVSQLPQPPLILAPQPPPPPDEPAIGRPFWSVPEVIKIILGLVALFGLATLGAHHKVRRLERRLRISGVITAGLPFVILGFVASLPSVGVLPETVLWVLRPVLVLALGWIGFVVGFRFDGVAIESIQRPVATAGFFVGACTFTSILIFCGALLIMVEPAAETGTFFRDAILIASAGSVIAHRGHHVPVPREGGGRAAPIWGIVHLQHLAGIIGLLIVAAYFRPTDSTLMWQLPGTAWLFITLGLGTAIGGIVYATLSSVKPGPDFVVVLLGSVGFAAGIAGFLRLSPIVVCFIAGFILANLPFHTRALVRATLVRLERPIYLVFLLVSGSLLRVGEWQGWMIMLLIVAGTILGRSLAWEVCRRRHVFVPPDDEKRRLTLAPLGALAVAVAVNAQLLYYGPAIPWLVVGVIGASIVTEILVQFSARGFLGGGGPARAVEYQEAKGATP